MRKWKNVKGLAVIFVVATGFLLWHHLAGAREDVAGVRLGTVKRGDLVRRVTVSGQVRPLRKTVFIAPYSGYIKKIYVHVGQKVKSGDPIFSVTPSFEGHEPVYPVRAPFAGVVVSVPAMEGEYVTEKDSQHLIARIDDISKFFVVAKAPELDVSRILKGMHVKIRVSALPGGGLLKGVVRDVDLAAEEAQSWQAQQATFRVKVEILDPPPDLRSGQSAILDIVTQKISNVLYLSHEFLNHGDGKYYVLTSQGEKKYVQIGRQSDTAVEIKSGLKLGDKVRQVDFLKLLESGS